jgi:uncharacterized Fe-S cluster-containing radical SAM superfamily protein
MPFLDTDGYSAALRAASVRLDSRELLVAQLRGSDQEVDVTDPLNCQGMGRVHHFRLQTPDPWPANPLPILPAARMLGIPVPEVMQTQVFQLASCNWRCWYCFVPYRLLRGNPRNARWMTAEQLVALYLDEPVRPRVVVCSGGQPDLVPEWVAWMMDALAAAGLAESVYLWSDDNLSNDYFWTQLDTAQVHRIQTYPGYGRVACFKGFDEESFAFNTRADPGLFSRQFDLFSRLLDLGIDLYAYATFTAPHPNGMARSMAVFVDRLQELHPLLPLRLVPLRVDHYGVMQHRMQPVHHDALQVQEEAIRAWNHEISTRFTAGQRATPITDINLRRRG